jgi:PAS domain S-box-containing protein
VGIAVLDSRGRIRIRNDAFTDLVGIDSDVSVEDIEGVAEMVEVEGLVDNFWDAVESDAPQEMHGSAYTGQGEAIPLRVVFHPVCLPSGQSWCICYLEVIYEVSTGEGHLYEQLNYVTQLAACMAEPMVGIDMNGMVKYWNQGSEALFGYGEDEILGKHVLTLVPEDLRREAQLVLKVVQEKGSYKNFDTQRLTKSGERIPVTLTVSAVRDEDGALIGTVATCKDLRGSKDLRDKAMEAEKLSAVLRMAVSVYHQVNDPLCVISANAQLLQRVLGEQDKEKSKKLMSILEAAKKISTVLDNLTQLTGVEPNGGARDGEEDTAA